MINRHVLAGYSQTALVQSTVWPPTKLHINYYLTTGRRHDTHWVWENIQFSDDYILDFERATTLHEITR